MQAGLEAVAAQGLVGESRADAVLGEPVGMDAQLEQLGQDGRRLVTVALELDDDEVAHEAVVVGYEVVEPQVDIDGEALGLALVDEGDTVEAVLEVFGESLWIVVQIGSDKGIVVVKAEAASGPCLGIEALGSGTLLLGAPVVVLRLHLKVVDAYMEIGTHAQLLALQMTHLMAVIHRTVLRIVVEGIIRCDDLAVDLLHVILVAGELKQLSEHGHRRDELRVDAVHQADIPHLVEGDGLEMVQNLCHTFAVFECKGRQIHHSGKTFSVNGGKLSTKREFDGAMVAAEDISMDLGIVETLEQTIRHHEVVDAPACILLAGLEAV